MDSCELIDQTETSLREAEQLLDDAEVTPAIICKTMLVCTRAICHEIAALRRVVNSIESDVTEIDFKLPEQD